MTWSALAEIGLTVRPFDSTPPAPAWTYSQFKAPLRQTLDTLRRELGHLVAERIVVELDITEADLRLDGYPRANARLLSPAVRISFDSHVGPLRYETAEFYTWQDNLRAIALSLEALRKVDRYGVSKRGEQYRGWRAIPMSTDPADTVQTRQQAEAVVGQYGGLTQAIKATHPDRGGDANEFRRVMKAKEILA